MKNTLIGILIVGIIAGTGYGIYYQVNKWNEKNKEVTTPKVETKSLDTDSEIVTKLMKDFSISENKTITAKDEYLGYLYSKSIFNKSDISDEYKIYTALNDLTKNSTEVTEIENIKVKEKIKDIFNDTYKDQSLTKDSCNLPKYNYTNDKYIKGELKCNSEIIGKLVTKINSANKETDTITITKAIYYEEIIDNKTNIYANVDKKLLIKENVSDSDIFNEYKNKIEKYKYTFKKNSLGNYYFEKIEKV